MWCPSATLSVWANAWLAGRAAPDDVLDALSCWAPTQSVAAYDAVAAGSAGLPWPDARDAGAVSLLQTLRAATGLRAVCAIRPVLPVPGDVRGLPAGTRFQSEALAAGEAVIAVAADGCSAVGLVPEFSADDADAGADDVLCWTVHALPGAPSVDQLELGEAEYALRSAVRLAAETLSTLDFASLGTTDTDPRQLVAQLLESSRRHQLPDHAPVRAVRVLQSAAHVDAIITVSSDVTAAAAHSALHAQRAADAVRPLAGVVRSARTAAVEAILRSAWDR